MAIIKCAEDNGDRIEVTDEGGNDIRFGLSGPSVWTTRDGAARFARQILALVGESETSAPEGLKVGDRVEIVRATWMSDNGKTGVLDTIDPSDPDLPYRVVDDNGVFIAWAEEVRKLEEPATPSGFPAYVEQAKTLLAGTDHTGADVIRLAELLTAA